MRHASRSSKKVDLAQGFLKRTGSFASYVRCGSMVMVRASGPVDRGAWLVSLIPCNRVSYERIGRASIAPVIDDLGSVGGRDLAACDGCIK
jgi:hypothetical protein